MRIRTPRGASTVELAVLAPLLIGMFLFSLFLTELIRARLKVQEAARYAAWELTSYSLNDYARGRHSAAFEYARAQTTMDAEARYRDLDSTEENSPPPRFILGVSPVVVEIQSKKVPGADEVVERFQLNPAGRVDVVARSLLDTRLPLGMDTGPFRIEHQHVLIANAWHLPDGADATVTSIGTGRHVSGSEHALYSQVKRMTFHGAKGSLESFAGFNGLSGFFDDWLPSLTGTFVVSHAYGNTGRPEGFDSDRDCNVPEHPAKTGMRNLRTSPEGREGPPLLDHERLRCFDTSPFRDTHDYSASLSIQQFQARGPYFMGCRYSQADDPTRSLPELSDIHLEKTSCVDP